VWSGFIRFIFKIIDLRVSQKACYFLISWATVSFSRKLENFCCYRVSQFLKCLRFIVLAKRLIWFCSSRFLSVPASELQNSTVKRAMAALFLILSISPYSGLIQRFTSSSCICWTFRNTCSKLLWQVGTSIHSLQALRSHLAYYQSEHFGTHCICNAWPHDM